MGKIELRSLAREDAIITWKWQNDLIIKEFYSNHPFPVTYEKELEWYEKIIKTNSSTKVFGIEIKEPRKLIGMTFLKNVNRLDRTEYAIFIGDTTEHGKGYSTEATGLTLEFGFNKLGLNRIWLKVHEDNVPAIHLYKKFKFRTEGILRQSVYRSNRYKNELLMALLKEDYTAYDSSS